MGLTKYDKNILAYRLLTIGELSLEESWDDQPRNTLANTPHKVNVGTLTHGYLSGLVVTINTELEGVSVVGLTSTDLTLDSAILKVKVNADEPSNQAVELEYMVNNGGSKIRVIEEE